MKPILPRIALTAFLLGLATTVGASEQGKQTNFADDMAAARACWSELDSGNFQLVRDKVLISPYQDANRIVAPATFPTASESKQLAALHSLATKCYVPPVIFSERMPNAATQKMLMFAVNIAFAKIGALEHLASRGITYAQYADIVAGGNEIVSDLVTGAQGKTSTPESEDSKGTLISLVCTVKNQGGTGSQYFGAEFQYTINTATLAATATKGADAPSDVQVSPTVIAFRQGKANVSISRVTGHWELAQNGVGVVFSGDCEPAARSKF